MDAAANSVGSAAESAAERNTAKYANLETQYIFQPIAVESLGPMHESARHFLAELERKISTCLGDDRESTFLF